MFKSMFLELFLMDHKASMLPRTLKNTRKGMGLCKVVHTKSQFVFVPVAASACSLLIPPHCRTHIRSMINSARFLDTQHTTQILLYGGHVSSRSPFLDSFTLPLRNLTQLLWFRDPPLPTFFARNFLSGHVIVLKAS